MQSTLMDSIFSCRNKADEDVTLYLGYAVMPPQSQRQCSFFDPHTRVIPHELKAGTMIIQCPSDGVAPVAVVCSTDQDLPWRSFPMKT